MAAKAKKFPRFFSIFGILTLYVTSCFFAFPSAFAAANPGESCKKIGITQKVRLVTYTCVKQGKRLVWDKGKLSLEKPTFVATTEKNDYTWKIVVLNSQKFLGQAVQFSYSYALDNGPWVLSSTSSAIQETILIKNSFSLIEFKVAVLDDLGNYLASDVFKKNFLKTVIPPNQPQTISNGEISNSNPSTEALPALVSIINGVQWRNEPGSYYQDKPIARVLFRWPKPSNSNTRGFIIRYENLQTTTPPCDLAKALCEGPKRVDSNVYKEVINNGAAESMIIDRLSINSQYRFTFFAVVGGVGNLENLTLPDVWSGPILFTSGEAVPQAPIVKVG